MGVKPTGRLITHWRFSSHGISARVSASLCGQTWGCGFRKLDKRIHSCKLLKYLT